MKLQYILSCVAIAGGVLAAAGADDLTKVITIAKDIVPQERDANRISQLPELSLPSFAQKKLKWTDRAVAAPLSPSFSLLPPAAYRASMDKYPYRGYLDLGYFPAFQLGLSAGYRLYDTEATKLNAWLQYNGNQYKADGELGNKITYKNHSAHLGLNLTHQVGEAGTLFGDLGYSFYTFNFPTGVLEPESPSFSSAFTEAYQTNGYTQSVNRFNFDLGWNGSAGLIDYHAAAGYQFFGFSKPPYALKSGEARDDVDAYKASDLKLDLGAFYNINDNNGVGLDFNILNTANKNLMWLEYDIADGVSSRYTLNDVESRNSGYYSVKPYYQGKGDNYSVKIGLQVNHLWSFGGDTHAGADIDLGWSPVSKFALSATIQSGNVYMNNISEHFPEDNYLNPALYINPSWNKGLIDLKLLIGPFSGASFEIFGGYGKLADWANQYVFSGTYSETLAGAHYGLDMDSYHYGIAFNYKYRSLASFRVSYEGAPQDIDKGYMYWGDRAKNAFNISVDVTPIESLDLGLSYEIRSGRAIYELLDMNNINLGTSYKKIAMANVNSLDFSARYAITPQFSVWAQAENLLNKKWDIDYGLPNKGITGLVGIGYKF